MYRLARRTSRKQEVFVGKVVKVKDGRFALVTDEQAGKGVDLDDQEKAEGLRRQER